jgi:hypothetical protein
MFVVFLYGRVCSTGAGRDRVVYQYEVNQSTGHERITTSRSLQKPTVKIIHTEHRRVRHFWRCRALALSNPPSKHASRCDESVGPPLLYIEFFDGIGWAGHVAGLVLPPTHFTLR